MGVRILSEAKRFAPSVPTYIGNFGARGVPSGHMSGRRSTVPRLVLAFDGTAGKEGLPAALAANEIWVDPSVLIHSGDTQVGINAMYMGPGTCAVSGAMYSSDMAYRVGGSEGAALYAAATQWETIATLNPNVAVNLLSLKPAYTLYRFVFATAVQPGNVTLTSL